MNGTQRIVQWQASSADENWRKKTHPAHEEMKIKRRGERERRNEIENRVFNLYADQLTYEGKNRKFLYSFCVHKHIIFSLKVENCSVNKINESFTHELLLICFHCSAHFFFFFFVSLKIFALQQLEKVLVFVVKVLRMRRGKEGKLKAWKCLELLLFANFFCANLNGLSWSWLILYSVVDGMKYSKLLFKDRFRWAQNWTLSAFRLWQNENLNAKQCSHVLKIIF